MRRRIIVFFYFTWFPQMAQNYGEMLYDLVGIDDSTHYSVWVKQDLNNESVNFIVHDKVLKLSGVQDITLTKIHSNSFLEMKFRVRAGSGTKIRRTVIVCVSHGKLYNVLDINSEVTSRLTDVYDKVADSLHSFDEQEDYLTMITVNKIIEDTYRTNIAEHVFVSSHHDPRQNLTSDKNYQLDFYPGQLVFYNVTKRLHGRYRINSNGPNGVIYKFINEDLSGIQLYNTLYLHLGGEWFQYDGVNLLSSQ